MKKELSLKKGERSKKQSFIQSDKAKKMLMASMVVGSAMTVGAIVVQVDKAEASTIYYWDKYIVSMDYVKLEDFVYAAPEEIKKERLQYWMSIYPNAYLVSTNTGSTIGYYKESMGSFIDTVSSTSGTAYPYDGIKDGNYYKFSHTVVPNRAPSIPILILPSIQFEHGDKQIIGWNVTDPDGDKLTNTLQASYNNGPWEDVYIGTERKFEYEVPKNKGTDVKFRVISSDGKLSSTSAESATKSIREVMYYWSKYTAKDVPIFTILEGEPTTSHYQKPDYMSDQGWTSYSLDSIGYFEPIGIRKRVGVYAEEFTGGTVYSGSANVIYKYTYSGDRYNFTRTQQILTVQKNGVSYQRGTLVQNNIQAGLNAYTHGARNADGFWYERGQRVLSEDVTPPIIELTEQTTPSPTVVVKVRTHDLGTVKTVKWAQGNQDVAYFGKNGTTISGTGQSTETSFTVSTNGVYTVYAEDNKGNASVQTITVSKVNTPPTVHSVQAINKFNVVDATTNLKINGTASDIDKQPLTATATYNGKSVTGNVIEGAFELELLGSNYANGFYSSPISVVANDSFTNSETATLNDHVIIRVDNAADYMSDLNGHTNDADTYPVIQHQAFYNAYEAVHNYERTRTTATLEDVTKKIDILKGYTSDVSTTLIKWQNRIDFVTATLAVEKSEKSLVKEDYNNAVTLVDALVETANKEALKPRLEELERYHAADEAITAMANEIAAARSEARSIDKTIVNWDKINEAQAMINVVTNATNKNALNVRLKQVIKDFMSIKGDITTEDLGGLGANDVKDELEGLYDDLKDAFQPLDENAQHLVDFVNALQDVLANLTPSKVTSFHAVVNGLPTAVQAKLTNTVAGVDGLLDLRQKFAISEVPKISNDIALVEYTLTQEYMVDMLQAMKEVIEFNEVDYDQQPSEVEKAEGQTEVLDLWEGQLKVDLEEYLNNGIPEVLINGDVYSHINDGTLTISGTVTDTNHTAHEVTVILNGVEKVVSTTDGTFETTFTNVPPGLNLDAVKVIANDSLTNKRITIQNKPIVTVTDVALFTQFVQALEVDKSQSFDAMDTALITDLYTLFNKVLAVTVDTGDRNIRDIVNEAEALSGQTEGELETLVKNYINDMRLVWLINNYKIATTDDFDWAGIKGVTATNINPLKAIIDNYVNSFNGGDVTTPTVDEYHAWIELLSTFEEIQTKIDSAKAMTDTKTLLPAITELETIVSGLPNWISQKVKFEDAIKNLVTLKAVIESVEQVEISFVQADHDTAKNLVDALEVSPTKTALEERLQFVQDVINATALVEQAETTKEESDINAAQTAVEALKDSPQKTELENRLNSLGSVVYAIELVKQAELTEQQTDVDNAKSFIDTLPSTSTTESLNDRLALVQDVIDARNALETAETTLDADDIVNAQTLIDAIDDSKASKQVLQDRLDNLNTLYDTIQAVIGAEKAEEQTSKDAAQVKVDALPPNEAQDRLNDRLAEVQKVIDGKVGVANAELTRDRNDVETAQTLVDAISDDKPTKLELQNRLDQLNDLLDAIKAVEQAEETVKQADKDLAEELVNALPEGADKEELKERLEQLQDAIDKKSAEEKAEDAVEKSEDTWSQDDFDIAQGLVDQLEEGDIKEDLQKRLDDLQQIINDYTAAKDAVDKAEVSKVQDDVDEAQTLVDALPNGEQKGELQNRLDEVNRFIEAEKAVSKVEQTLIQKHKDEAQALVDKLQPSAEKDELQNRLDAIQKAIDDKEDDLIDRIVNGDDITSEDLADYTDETVYEELLDEYLDEIKDIANSGSISKEDVIEAVRLINSYNIAIRSMLMQDIQAYANELSIATIPTKAKYPNPSVLEAINAYVTDDENLTVLAQELAALLNRSYDDVLAEMENILAAKEEVTSGDYTIQYITEDGQVIDEMNVEEKYGFISIEGVAPQGYEIVGESIQVFELSKETTGSIITFIVKELSNVTTGDTATIVGSYEVEYVTADNELVHRDSFEEIKIGTINVYAKLPEGYILSENQSDVQVIELTEEQLSETVTFVVESLNPSIEDQIPPVEEGEGQDITDENETEGTLDPTEDEIVEEEEQDVTDKNETEGTLDPTEDETLDETEEEQVQDDGSEVVISDTVGIETAFVRSLLIASLDEVQFTSSSYKNGQVSREQYLYDAGQALVLVKAYIANPTEAGLEKAKDFIVVNLYDGAYKELLLSYLSISIGDIGNGDDGEPDLTPVYPYKPPVVQPPTPPTEEDGNNGADVEEPTPPVTIEPPVEQPSVEEPPIITPPVEGEGTTTADVEKVHDVEELEDGGFKWAIEHPAETNYSLTANGITIELTFNEKLNAEMLEIVWKHLGNEHYSLQVYVDGEELKEFKSKVTLSKTKEFAYMLRQVDNAYKAMPYNYSEGTFNFTVTRPGIFYFTKDKRTFDDIAKFIDTKDAIEELASRHIIYGTTDTKFNPNGKLTRAQFAAMISRSLGLEPTGNNPFVDTQGKWYEGDVQALYEAGIISGTSTTTFNPNAYVTRQQAALMLDKVMRYTGYNGNNFNVANDNSNNSFAKLPTFADSHLIADNARLAVAKLESLKIVQGKSEGIFDPQGSITRSQMAKMLTGVLKITGNM